MILRLCEQRLQNSKFKRLKISPLPMDNLSERRDKLVKNGEFFMIQEIRQRGMSITSIAKMVGS
ncbi:hypothetical protein CIG75_03870 [Tumebacillus algifaecis]|uniref:Uncharacterized protein n=1 Tax=Tumebacillus algifaecis TaxID=1214604 RepID=A0A223CY00_9BACL|nr:hypothetical protein CIG75_03870 [Tumebacillus algifaecis]